MSTRNEEESLESSCTQIYDLYGGEIVIYIHGDFMVEHADSIHLLHCIC